MSTDVLRSRGPDKTSGLRAADFFLFYGNMIAKKAILRNQKPPQNGEVFDLYLYAFDADAFEGCASRPTAYQNDRTSFTRA